MTVDHKALRAIFEECAKKQRPEQLDVDGEDACSEARMRWALYGFIMAMEHIGGAAAVERGAMAFARAFLGNGDVSKINRKYVREIILAAIAAPVSSREG